MADFIYIDSTGTIIADTADTKSQVEAIWTAAFGADIDLDSSTVEGLIIATQVIILDSLVANNALIANQINPNLAEGIFLDSLSALTALSRNVALSSTVTAQLTGVAGTNIPLGSIASTLSGDEFSSDVAVILDGAGEGSVSFSSIELGPIACGVNNLTNIVSNVIGWETVDNAAAAILGKEQESDIELRLRRRRTLALQGVSISEAVSSNVSDVDGVNSLTFRENVSDASAVFDGVTLGAHSIYVCVSGGTDDDVALALLESKSAGAGWNSQYNPTVVIVTDATSGQDYTVEFDRQTDVAIFAEVEIDANGITDSVDKVKEAILAYANGALDGQDGFVVGANASPFEMSGAINVVHPQILVKKFEVGTSFGVVFPIEINIEIWEQATIANANISVTEGIAPPGGVIWTSQISAADNVWRGVTYGNDVFVAVADSGTGNQVMISSDGNIWASRTSAADNEWRAITYGNDIFVAVSSTGTGDRVMTSPDGSVWTAQVSAVDNDWMGIAYGNDIFVAVATSGSGNRVMTSPDGINWTAQVSAANNTWDAVAFGNGLFVAVADTGLGNRVMTSPDGIIWTIRVSAADKEWEAITYGNGLFVAVADTGTGDLVMTSPDGVTWTSRASAADNAWRGVTFANGLFVAVSGNGLGNRVMTSPDGIVWTIRVSAADNNWQSVAFGNDIFVAVAASGLGNRVMTSAE